MILFKAFRMENNYLQRLRHTTEHIFNQAIEELYPNKVKRAIGPTIENGWYFDGRIDFEISPDFFSEIESRMMEIVKRKLPIVKVDTTYEKALEIFRDNEFKHELLNDLKTEGKSITLYYTGEPNKESSFVDLCAGPHVDNTSEIKYFKLLSVAGAYWRGDSNREMLTRVYGTTFETQEELDNFLKQREEAEKRNHRKIGKDMELFGIFKEIGQGLPVWLPNGYIMRRVLEDYMLELEQSYGYHHILTPHINNQELFQTSGHLGFYNESMYAPIVIDDETYYLKPMNCPAGMVVFKMKPKSYRDLPYKLGELGTVYRFEQSGELQGLQRVRGFTQNDAHIFCTEDQLESQFMEVIEMLNRFYLDLGFTNYKFRLSLSDPENKEKYVGNREKWEMVEDILRKVLHKNQIDFYETRGEAAFYGPKLDVQAVNVFGKEDTISTIQVDFNLPERFNLTYIDSNGEKKQPYVIHRALIGSFERFFAFLIEFYAGAFPFWLAPKQIAILPISPTKHSEYANVILKKLKAEKFRVELVDSNETLDYRIRNIQNLKIPYLLVVGDREMQSNTLSVRKRHEDKSVTLSIDNFLDEIRSQRVSI